MRTTIFVWILAGAAAVTPVFAQQQPAAAQDQAETIEVGQSLARFALLKPSTRLYLRYKVVGDSRQTIDLWRRQVSFEEQDGKPRMHIIWRWDSVGDRKFASTRDYWFERGTFRPLTITRRLVEGDKTTVSGFEYQRDRIVGSADLPDNLRKDFVQAAKLAPYAFETDMELLQALPLRRGYAVRIPFYEPGPGQPEPRYYTYRVVGDDRIAGTDGAPVDCWIVETANDEPGYGPTRFWFSKRNQVMVREQTRFPDGSLFVKALLTSDTATG